MATLPAPKPVLREGRLQKRQRGKHVKGNNYTGLKFQSRFVSLNTEYLHYFRPQDKKHKGKFPVSSIAFVQEVPPGTFEKIKYGFQIGSKDQNEVMFFGAGSNEDRIKWMEAIRLGAMFSNNVMASHYHPGAYGKAVQGEWSCCRKGKTAQGCCETGFRDRAQSAILFSISNDEAHDYDDDDDDEYDDDDEMNEYSKSLPSNYGLMPTPLHDTASVISTDSGMYESKSSLISAVGIQGAPLPKWTEEQAGEIRYEENHEISQILERHKYTLLVAADYGAGLNSLDFRGNDSLVVGRKDEVYVLDVANHGNMFSADFSGEVTSVETWRSLLLISTKGGVYLYDLDNREINHQLEFETNDTLESVTVDTGPPLEPRSATEYHAAFTPDGSRIVMANGNTLEVKEVPGVRSLHSKKLPGKILLLSVSPDPKLPKVVACVVKNDALVLCICDYLDEKGCSEINTGPYEPSSSICAHFLPSDTKLAVWHGRTVTIVEIGPGRLQPEIHAFTTEKGVTSLQYSPIGDHLVLGMNDGNVVVLDGRADTFSVQHILEFSSQSNAAVTALAFSKDCSLLAVGQNDGKLNVVRRTFIMKKKTDSKELPSVTIPANGGILKWKEDDVSVVFPAGFIAQPSLTFQYCVKTHENPHTFPPGVRPVSAVLALHPESDVNFLKPVEVTMPHFIDLEDEDDCKRLKVFVAGPIKPGEEGLNFKAMSQDAAISLLTSRPYNYKHMKQYAKFSIEHCCNFCVGEYFKEDTDKALIVLARAQSKLKVEDHSRELFLHHCFHYNLPTLSKLVKKQFPEELYTLTNYFVRFSDDSNPSVEIKVNNPRELEGNGWKSYIQNGAKDNKICQKDIDFWEIPTSKQLEHMCEQRIYPPRLILRVFSSSPACKDTDMKVAFPGVVYEWPRRRSPILTISLKGVDRTRMTEFESKCSSRVTSFSNSSKRQLSQPVNKHAEEALQSSFYFLCKEVSETADLAALLYTNELLSNSHLHEFIKKVEPGSLENMRMVYNIQLLRHVQSAISEDPGKFDALCATFDDLQLSHCSQRLRDTFHEKKMASNFASTSTLSGSENSTGPSQAASVCQESTMSTPRPSDTGYLHLEPNVHHPSESDLPVFFANAGTED